MSERMLTSQDVAEQLRMSAKVVREYFRDGHIGAIFSGRQWLTTQADVEAYKARLRTRPAVAGSGQSRRRTT